MKCENIACVRQALLNKSYADDLAAAYDSPEFFLHGRTWWLAHRPLTPIERELLNVSPASRVFVGVVCDVRGDTGGHCRWVLEPPADAGPIPAWGPELLGFFDRCKRVCIAPHPSWPHEANPARQLVQGGR